MLADKGYDSDEVIVLIEEQGSIAVIPSRKCRKKTREYDRDIYKERNLVERFFGRIKQFRRVATRYEKLADHYLAVVQIASIRLWSHV